MTQALYAHMNNKRKKKRICASEKTTDGVKRQPTERKRSQNPAQKQGTSKTGQCRE
jgi:hypothetical protein